MNKKTIVKNHFTLVELLVSMAIFSVLLLVSMQIFSSSRRLWLNAENKNKIYAEARTAMEFITSRIQTQAYTENMPFLIDRQDPKDSKMFFPTAMPMNRKDENGKERDKISMRFIGFSRSEDGILRMHIYSDEGKLRSFQENMPPFARKKQSGEASTYEAACKTVMKNTVDKNDYSGEEHNCIELMENVVHFELSPRYRVGYLMGVQPGAVYIASSKNSPPYKLDITLGVIDSKENFENWKNNTLTGNENTYYFRRSILLNYRGAR